jgi:hypothetical protein
MPISGVLRPGSGGLSTSGLNGWFIRAPLIGAGRTGLSIAGKP